jgi:RecB family endonuclease NucS
MIEKQAEHISRLNKELSEIHQKHAKVLERNLAEYQRIAPYARFYEDLQKTIIENPTLIEEWSRFLLLVKLTNPDADKPHYQF